MLISAAQHSEPAECIHMHPALGLPPTPTHPRSSRSAELTSWLPRSSHQQLCAQQCVYVGPHLPACSTRPLPFCLPVSSLHLRLYSCPVNRFLCTTFLNMCEYTVFVFRLLCNESRNPLFLARFPDKSGSPLAYLG